MKSLYLLLICCLILTACSSNPAANSSTQQEKYIPTLEVSVEVSGTTAIATVVTDMSISEEHAGKARKKGEGHIHMYLDDGEKETVTQGIKEYTNLASGSHKLRVSLHNNDHTPYDVTESISFEVK